jgi:hypothetical protein
MAEQGRVGLPSEKGAMGILVGFAAIGVLLVLAFAILAGYSVGKDLQSRQAAPANAAAGR